MSRNFLTICFVLLLRLLNPISATRAQSDATIPDSDVRVDAQPLSGSTLLIRDAVENAKKWRFQANAQKSAVIVYNFTLPGGFCKSGGSLFLQQGANIATIIGCDVPVYPITSKH